MSSVFFVVGSSNAIFTSSFPKKCPLLLKLLLLNLKPSRLSRMRTGMELKALWREVTLLCHLPQLNLKSKV
jgi:hypothetical protein